MKTSFNTETIIYKLIGSILLTPAIIGVYLFISLLLVGGKFSDTANSGFTRSEFWGGDIEYYRKPIIPYDPTYEGGDGGGGYTSPIPIYMGLMAIAGVMLITKKAEK